MLQKTHTFFSFSQAGVPAGVDPKNKELYLNDADFTSLMGMTKAAWETAPAWKKTAAKKKVGMF